MRLRSLPLAIILGLLAFLAYRYTAAPDLLFGDAGEFQFTTHLAGISHPTGYPLYHILGWLWGRLYVANPAQGANHFSAFWGGVAVATFYLLAYEVLAQFLSRLKWNSGVGFMAAIPTLIFAANPTFWAQATLAEVYTLNAVLMAAILGATLAVGRKDENPGGAWVVALLLGLGLTHHLTTILLIPGILLYFWLVRPDLLNGRSLLRLAPFTLLPLLLYFYVPLRVPASPWLAPELAPGQTLQLFDSSMLGTVRFVLGVGFAPALHGPGAAIAQIPAAAQLFLLHFGWIGLAIIIVGLVGLILEGQIPMLAFTGVTFLMLVGFNLFYGIADIYTFYIPPYIIATLWLGSGLAYGVDLLARLTSTRWRPYFMAITLVVLIIPYLYFRDYRSDFDRTGDYLARIVWTRILRQDLADDAILVSNDRDEMTPFVYLQQIADKAPNMTGLFPLISSDPGWSDLNATLASSLDTGRPVYVIKDMPGIEALYETDDVGEGVSRVLDHHPTPDPSFEMPYGDNLRWLNIDWRGDTSPGGEITVNLYWRVTETPPVILHSFLQIYNSAGERVMQADDHRPGGEYLPSTLWRPGDVVVDTFTMPLPEVLPPGDYTLVAGFYDPIADVRYAAPLTVASLISPALYE